MIICGRKIIHQTQPNTKWNEWRKIRKRKLNNMLFKLYRGMAKYWSYYFFAVINKHFTYKYTNIYASCMACIYHNRLNIFCVVQLVSPLLLLRLFFFYRFTRCFYIFHYYARCCACMYIVAMLGSIHFPYI